MAVVDASRAALVSEGFARTVEATAGAPGFESVVVTACARAAGAAAFASRVAPLATRGLQRWRLATLGHGPDHPIGSVVHIDGSELRALSGVDLVVVGKSSDPNTGEVTYTLRGPA